jgi:hypothetical protein
VEAGRTLHGATIIEVGLERRRGDINDEVLGWEPTDEGEVQPNPVPQQNQRVADPGPLLWSGRVALPTGGRPVRVVVREFEEYEADAEPGAAQPVITARRLVYADALVLD